MSTMARVEERAVERAEPHVPPVRRSSRLRVAIPVVISWTNSSQLTVRARGETEVISLHGALLKMDLDVSVGAEVLLSRPETGKKVKGRVVAKGLTGPDGLPRAAVEILSADATFWGVTFPD